jgi:hypothetical protein
MTFFRGAGNPQALLAEYQWARTQAEGNALITNRTESIKKKATSHSKSKEPNRHTDS